MSLTVVWMGVGCLLCLMELLIPTAFLESALGVSAFAVALLSLVVPSFSWQVALWMLFSFIAFGLLRRLVPKKTLPALIDATAARTLTAIPPGRTGRVMYEGNSWQASCSDCQVAIAPDQIVLVVGRQGNTLMVLPESTLQE